MISHIGANSIVEVKELAAHAQSVKVDAIAILPPFFYKAEVFLSSIKYIYFTLSLSLAVFWRIKIRP